MPRVVTIGDSISQGFTSGAAARTDLCYSTLIAGALGLKPGADYRFPEWPLGGLPLNFEILLRHLSRYYGDDIWGPFEWGSAAVRISNFIDKLEDHYERGAGDYAKPDPNGAKSYHNLASFGFTVSDAWEATPGVCLERLEPDGMRPIDDESFATPSDAFYRSAFRVLNPEASRTKKALGRSQLDWVQQFADDDGVENLLVWLGANNALGTVLRLQIDKIRVEPDDYRNLGHFEKSQYNLWRAGLFKLDVIELFDRLEAILNAKKHLNKQKDWRVFVGTIPAVTIAPIVKGLGQAKARPDPFGVLSAGATYYEYYSYVIFDLDAVRAGDVGALTRDEAYKIDRHIANYNQIIREEVRLRNDKLGEARFHVVDVADSLLRLAYKRNNGKPTYPLPEALRSGGRALVDSRYYHAEDGRMTRGGVFSLDGVHPSAIGQGLVAHEFLQAMEAAGRKIKQPLDWDRIMRQDSLFSRPLDLIQEIYQHDRLARILIRSMRSPEHEV